MSQSPLGSSVMKLALRVFDLAGPQPAGGSAAVQASLVLIYSTAGTYGWRAKVGFSSKCAPFGARVPSCREGPQAPTTRNRGWCWVVPGRKDSLLSAVLAPWRRARQVWCLRWTLSK